MGYTNLSITPAYELRYSRSSGAIYQLQSSRDLVTWTNAYYAVTGPSGDDNFLLPSAGSGSMLYCLAAGDPTNVMDFSRARMLPISDNMLHFENVLWRSNHYWVDFRSTLGLRESAKGLLPRLTIPRVGIVIDGDASDWASIPPVYTDPAHDLQPPDNHPGTDSKEFRLARDDQFIYAAYTLHDAYTPA